MTWVLLLIIFFFSSRRRHTRYWRDWSSDVCSSDLARRCARARATRRDSARPRVPGPARSAPKGIRGSAEEACRVRSEERREGKSVDLGGRRSIKKKRDKESGEEEYNE